MTEEDFEQFLLSFDLLCIEAQQQGFSAAALSGAVLARSQQLYLADDQADIEGLIRLLEYSLEQLRNRPQWPVI